MDFVGQLRAFVATAQTASFTAAAEQLGVSNRLTSKYIGELEKRLGVRLFQRTTRTVGLTPAGEDLLARAPALLDDLDALLADVSEGSRGFSGVIRISAPVTLGEVYVAGMLGRFGDQNPGLTLDLRLDDKYSDLAAEGIDLAIRVGTSRTLSIKSRKLGETRTALVASPRYLERFGTPTDPEDLRAHACIIDMNRRQPRRWGLLRGAEQVEVEISGKLLVNSARAASALAEAGHGIALSPRFAVRDPVASGRLVTLLDGYTAEPLPVSAVYLEGRSLPRKVRALIDFAAQDIRSAEVL
jgi:DNA-binding transcriptional LysR family regulator